MKIRIKDLVTVSAILTMILLSGCIGQEEEIVRTRLIIAQPDEPDLLDSQVATWSNLIHSLTSQPPVAFNMDLSNMVPDFCTSWEVSDDGKVITFHLPEGYKYANGDSLDAQALKDAWTRYKAISPYSSDLEPIIEMNVIDETTLNVVNDNPPAFMWAVLATEYGAPYNVAEAERVGDEEFGVNPVASGPFKLKEWVHGSHILLERNDNY